LTYYLSILSLVIFRLQPTVNFQVKIRMRHYVWIQVFLEEHSPQSPSWPYLFRVLNEDRVGKIMNQVGMRMWDPWWSRNLSSRLFIINTDGEREFNLYKTWEEQTNCDGVVKVRLIRSTWFRPAPAA
jgi:hypothetical protein